MGQRHVCTFRHAQRAAYRRAISAAQILVLYDLPSKCTHNFPPHRRRVPTVRENTLTTEYIPLFATDAVQVRKKEKKYRYI